MDDIDDIDLDNLTLDMFDADEMDPDADDTGMGGGAIFSSVDDDVDEDSSMADRLRAMGVLGGSDERKVPDDDMGTIMGGMPDEEVRFVDERDVSSRAGGGRRSLTGRLRDVDGRIEFRRRQKERFLDVIAELVSRDGKPDSVFNQIKLLSLRLADKQPVKDKVVFLNPGAFYLAYILYDSKAKPGDPIVQDYMSKIPEIVKLTETTMVSQTIAPPDIIRYRTLIANESNV